jgi:hypothetical protein
MPAPVAALALPTQMARARLEPALCNSVRRAAHAGAAGAGHTVIGVALLGSAHARARAAQDVRDAAASLLRALHGLRIIVTHQAVWQPMCLNAVRAVQPGQPQR